jgi:lipoprotein NlpI
LHRSLFPALLIASLACARPAIGQAADSGLCNAGADARRAIAACSAAIRADPGNAVAYNHRGTAHSRAGAFERALADYSEAVRLNPQYALAFRNRARVHFYRSDFAAAAADFAAAEAIDRGNAYALLWRYIAEARAGIVDRAGLHRALGGLREGWPKPLVLFYLNRLGADAVLAEARAEPARAAERLCEAHFFLGQERLLAGETAAAIAAFRRGAEVCPRDIVEHQAIRVELNRLGARAP